LAAGVAVGSLMTLAGPVGLRQLDFFRVRQVELIGVRYHAPERLLEAAAIGTQRNLFDSVRDVEKRLERLPSVVRVDVKRRLPGTLRLVVTERVPIAFAPAPTGMVALDVDARPIPYDPTTADLDLPVVQHARPAVVRALAAVQAADSALFQSVVSARQTADGSVLLQLERERVLLRPDPTPDEIAALVAVRRSLRAGSRSFDRFDARFVDRVFVGGGS